MAHPPEVLEELRRRLLERRHALVRMAQGSQAQLEAVRTQERIPEVEEEAQTSHAAYVFTQLSDGQRQEVARIDAALQRIEAGTYGACVDCGAEIPLERLRALPFALRDTDCSEAYEGHIHHPTL